MRRQSESSGCSHIVWLLLARSKRNRNRWKRRRNRIPTKTMSEKVLSLRHEALASECQTICLHLESEALSTFERRSFYLSFPFDFVFEEEKSGPKATESSLKWRAFWGKARDNELSRNFLLRLCFVQQISTWKCSLLCSWLTSNGKLKFLCGTITICKMILENF